MTALYMQTDMCTFMITSRSFLLGIKNISDKSCRENQNAHFVFSNCFPKILLLVSAEYTVQLDRPQMTIRRMRIACWIPKATNTHSKYVTLIAFPLQQWLHERASMLRYTYVVLFVLRRLY